MDYNTFIDKSQDFNKLFKAYSNCKNLLKENVGSSELNNKYLLEIIEKMNQTIKEITE